jgi:hypothetical protein
VAGQEREGEVVVALVAAHVPREHGGHDVEHELVDVQPLASRARHVDVRELHRGEAHHEARLVEERQRAGL